MSRNRLSSHKGISFPVLIMIVSTWAVIAACQGPCIDEGLLVLLSAWHVWDGLVSFEYLYPQCSNIKDSGANIFRIQLFMAEIIVGKKRLSRPPWVSQKKASSSGSRTGVALKCCFKSSGRVVALRKWCQFTEHYLTHLLLENGSPYPKPILQAGDRDALAH